MSASDMNFCVSDGAVTNDLCAGATKADADVAARAVRRNVSLLCMITVFIVLRCVGEFDWKINRVHSMGLHVGDGSLNWGHCQFSCVSVFSS